MLGCGLELCTCWDLDDVDDVDDVDGEDELIMMEEPAP